MTSREYDCVAAHESVLTVLTDNADLYPTFKPLIRARTELESVVAGIMSAGQKQETSAKPGLGDQKLQARFSLVTGTHIIAAALHAAAVTAEMPELARRVDYTFTGLGKGRDAKVVERCMDVHTAATENLPLLAESEIDAKALKDLKSGIDAFEKLKPGPRDRRVARTTATKSVKTLFAQSQALLNNRIDKHMVKFKQSEPDFYNAYKSARKIVALRGRSSDAEKSKVLKVPAVPKPASGEKAA